MTEAKSCRRFRRSRSGSIPKTIATWFGGSRQFTGPAGSPWICWTVPHSALMPEYWRTWKASNPQAVPPPGFEWLEDPNRHPPQWQVEAARKHLA